MSRRPVCDEHYDDVVAVHVHPNQQQHNHNHAQHNSSQQQPVQHNSMHATAGEIKNSNLVSDDNVIAFAPGLIVLSGAEDEAQQNEYHHRSMSSSSRLHNVSYASPAAAQAQHHHHQRRHFVPKHDMVKAAVAKCLPQIHTSRY